MHDTMNHTPTDALFSPFDVAGLRLPNRFMRSATFDASAEPDGAVSQRQVRWFSALAAGGVGLIVSGITCVDDAGRLSPLQNSAARDRDIPGLARLAEAAHAHGAKAAVQLYHGGLEAARFLGGDPLALAPSDPLPGQAGFRAMTPGEAQGLAQAFGAAAGRVRRAGFDAVQLHCAHAYLFAQFLSPLTNRRSDEFGGSLANRLRFHRLTIQAARESAGPDFPILIKLGLADGAPGGLSLDEGLAAAGMLADEGAALIEVSQGLRGPVWEQTEFRRKVDRPGGQAYFRAWAAALKTRVTVPVALVGGLRELGLCREVIARGEADLVSLSRPLIREPGLIARWRGGDEARATCVSCNLCLEGIMRREPLACRVEERKP